MRIKRAASKRIGPTYSYSVSSDNPRTVALVGVGFLPLLITAIICFIAIFFLPDHALMLMAGFALCIIAAIGWLFFAIHYGKRHFERVPPTTLPTASGSGTQEGK